MPSHTGNFDRAKRELAEQYKIGEDVIEQRFYAHDPTVESLRAAANLDLLADRDALRDPKRAEAMRQMEQQPPNAPAQMNEHSRRIAFLNDTLRSVAVQWARTHGVPAETPQSEVIQIYVEANPASALFSELKALSDE